jgi:hypothetical protein
VQKIYKNWKILKTIYKDSYKLNPNAGGVSDEDEVKTLASPRLLSNANKFFNGFYHLNLCYLLKFSYANLITKCKHFVEDSDMHMQMPFSTNLQNNINLNMSSSSSDLSIQTSSSSSEFISGKKSVFVFFSLSHAFRIFDPPVSVFLIFYQKFKKNCSI